MTTNPSNPRQPVSEDALVDWIDGSLSPQDVRRLAAESGRADLHDRIGQMQRHRDVLRSLGDTQGSLRAPTDMHARVMATLERESLVGHESVEQELRALERAAPADTAPVANLRLVQGEGSTSHWTKRAPSLALAAGLLLLVTGGAYWTMQMLRSASPKMADPSKTIAMADANKPVATESTAPAGADAAATPMMIASNDATQATEAAGARMNVTTMAAGPVAREVTIEEAVALAREGRLAIRVTARDLRGLSRLEQDGATRRGTQSWQLSRDVPPAVLAAALPATSEASRAFVRAAHALGSSTESGTAMFSTASLISPLIGPGATVTTFAPAVIATGPALSASYLLDVPQTERAFDAVRAVLRDRLKGEVVFAELPDAMPAATKADAQSALWWTKPSSQWSPRVTVPVLVER
jgi:hypothetical protein